MKKSLSKKYFLLNFVIFWWSLWVGVSYINFSGLDEVSSQAYAIFIVFIGMVLFGFLTVRCLAPFKGWRQQKIVRLNFLYIACYFLIIVYTVYFIRFVLAITAVDSLGDYRLLYYGLSGEGSVIFGNVYIAYFQHVFIYPCLLAVYFLALGVSISQDDNRLVLLATFIVLVDGLISGGRFGIYLVFIFSGLLIIVKYGYAYLFNNKVLGVAAILCMAIIYLSQQRLEGSVYDLLKLSILDYHTFGFVLFDKYFFDSTLMPLDGTSSFYSLGFFYNLYYIIFGSMGFVEQNEITLKLAHLHEPIVVGLDEFGNYRTANAFYTFLFSVYADGGVMAVLLFGYVYGSVFSFVLGTRLKHMLPMAFFLAYVGVFGIFTPLLMGNAMLVPIIIMAYTYVFTDRA